MKISITKKIITLAVAPLFLVILVSSIGSAVLLGSKLMDEEEKQLKLASYAIQRETAKMTVTNTKEETVTDMLNEFKENNNIDVTIFSGDTREFSTVTNVVGTKMDAEIFEIVKNGKYYFTKNANVNGEKYYACYYPVMNNGEYVGAFFTGEPAERVDGLILQNMINMCLMTIFIGIAAIFLSIKVAKKIAKRIEGLKNVLETLSDNDLTVTNEKIVVENDEIDEINNKTIDFSKNLRQIISSIKSTSNDLKKIASDLNTNAQYTNETCREISQAIENVANGAVSQAEDTANAAQNVSEMSVKLGKIKNITIDLHNIADSMNNAKNNALITLAELQKVNGTMENEIDSTRTQVNATSKSVEQIKAAVGMIQSIADQTKLLSLNASIEAARAGDAGRGFSVVAEEIGKLAEQSASSSDEIEEILTHLVENYSVIIENVKRTFENMSIQNKKMADTQNVFEVLENDIGGTVKRIVEINEMIETLNTEIGKFVDTISNLSAISEENSASTEETTAGIEELTEIINQVAIKAQNVDASANKLMDEINTFKTE